MIKLLVFMLLMCAVVDVQAQAEINIMTFNIRYNNPGDSLNAWPYRKDKAVSQIIFHDAQIVGVQEALYGQINDLISGLHKYKYVGVGRSDGKQKGEYSAILYDSMRFKVLESGTFWLAEKTDSVGLKGWDAAIERIVTWARFRDLQTKKTFYHFNTHFDHMGKVARRESAKLLLAKVAEISKGKASVITGDFNAQPSDEPIVVIADKQRPDHLTDSKDVSQEPHYGPSGTFNAFGPKEVNNQPIDYIFYNRGWKVLKHATLSQGWEGRFSSDHFPVMARMVLAER